MHFLLRKTCKYLSELEENYFYLIFIKYHKNVNLIIFEVIMSNTFIFHNPHCSKSRKTLELLKQSDIDFEVRLYLQDPPNVNELDALLKILEIEPRSLMRVDEDEYDINDLENQQDRNALIEAMVSYPILIQRPIVVHNGKARIGRPPEAILEIL